MRAAVIGEQAGRVVGIIAMDGTQAAQIVTPALVVVLAAMVWWVRRPLDRPLVAPPHLPRWLLTTMGAVFLVWGLVHGWQTVRPTLDRLEAERDGVIVTAEVYDPEGFLQFGDAVSEQSVCDLAQVRYEHGGSSGGTSVRVRPNAVREGDRLRIKVVPLEDLPARSLDHGCRRPVDSPALPVAVMAIAVMSITLRKLVAT